MSIARENGALVPPPPPLHGHSDTQQVRRRISSHFYGASDNMLPSFARDIVRVVRNTSGCNTHHNPHHYTTSSPAMIKSEIDRNDFGGGGVGVLGGRDLGLGMMALQVSRVWKSEAEGRCRMPCNQIWIRFQKCQCFIKIM